MAAGLAAGGLHNHCLAIIKGMLPYWQGLPVDDAASAALFCNCELLKPLPLGDSPPANMAPFFLKAYVKSHSSDVFEAYAQLLTEMALRIPYQMRKIADSAAAGSGGSAAVPSPHFDNDWFYVLCELMMTPQAPFVKRQVRKLLLLISYSKAQYRQLRDMHTLETRIREIKITVAKGGFDFSDREGNKPINLPYDTLISLIEQLKTCVEVAESRTLNWQRFCMSDETVLPFLLQISSLVDNGVAPFVLQLLQAALCMQANAAAASGGKDSSTGGASKPSRSKSASPVKGVRAGKEKTRASEEPEEEDTAVEAAQCSSDETLRILLSHMVLRWITPQGWSSSGNGWCMSKFIEKFLLESNTTSVRWQAHALLVALHSHALPDDDARLIAVLWELWAKVPQHGRRSAQFVDVLGYFSVAEHSAAPGYRKNKPGTVNIATSEAKEEEETMSRYALMAVTMLKRQNRILAGHANSSIYTALASLVDFTGFYLESDPCLVCNNPEVPFAPLKLGNLKVDTKYTTSTQMVKLAGSHSISKIVLRIGDLKRQKMVRTINIYYNNR